MKNTNTIYCDPRKLIVILIIF